MPADQISQIISQVRDLPLAEQARLLEELRQLVPQNGAHPLHRVSELKGLGQDIWDGIDAQEYVRNGARRMEWIAKLAGRMVAIDTAPFIYLIEAHPKYLAVVEQFFVALDHGDFQAVTSTLTLLEVLVQPLRKNDVPLADRYRDILLRSPNLLVVPLTAEIAEQAAIIRATAGLTTPDAIQIATALYAGATSFLTNDAKIAKLSTFEVLILDDLISV